MLLHDLGRPCTSAKIESTLPLSGRRGTTQSPVGKALASLPHHTDTETVNALRFFVSALAKFDRDRGLFLASGIAFQVLLCLVPLALLVLSFAGTYLLTNESVTEQVEQYLARAAPVLDPAVRKGLLEIVTHRRTSGLVGTIGLLWMATTVFSWLRVALNTIFNVPAPHGILRGLAVDFVMIVLSTATFVASVGLTAAIEYLQRVRAAIFPAAPGLLLRFALSYGVPFVVTIVFCFLIFRLLPNRRVATRAAIWGAVFTGVFWEAAKHLFAWYILAFGSYSIVYGSLSAAAVVLVWTYYAAAALLLGAEVTSLLEARGEAGRQL
jgi:membrane protein